MSRSTLARPAAAVAAVALALVVFAGPASAGPPECTSAPAGQGLGDCTLVIGGDDPSVTGADTLPRTGEDSLPLAQMGVVLVGLGALVVLFARKRGDTRT